MLYPLALTLVGLSVGLWFHWKPAAVAFLLMTGGLSLWLGIGTMMHVPLEYWHINLTFSALLLLPGVAIVRNWSRL